MYFVSKQESQSLEKTVSRRFNKEKLVARNPCHKLLILKKNHKVRRDFATEHILCTEEQWNMVYFSDESKFSLFGSVGKRFERRKNEERWDKRSSFLHHTNLLPTFLPLTSDVLPIFLRLTNLLHLTNLNALRKLWNLEGERNGVRDDFFSWSRTHCSFSP